jgi:thioredoxin reductase (NADPH)
MKTLVIAENIGGTIVNTGIIENYPGFERISGMELAEKLERQAKKFHIKIVNQRVEKVFVDGETFAVVTQEGKYTGRTIIFAMGTEWKKLGVQGEKEFMGRGVHYCALCDGAFYKGKVVAVIGGSDSAVADAILLAEYAKKVYIIIRKGKLRAEPVNQDKICGNKKIEIIKNTNVVEIKGNKFVEKIILDKAHKGSKELKLGGIFIDVGHIPLSKIAKDFGVRLNEKAEIIIDRNGFTNKEGVFAAGDVVDTKFKQAITGVAEGVAAAYNAYNYLKRKGFIKGSC